MPQLLNVTIFLGQNLVPWVYHERLTTLQPRWAGISARIQQATGNYELSRLRRDFFDRINKINKIFLYSLYLPAGRQVLNIPGPDLASQDAVMQTEAFIMSENSCVSTSRRARAGLVAELLQEMM